MNVTLIGGNGFIGSHIIDRLIKNDKYNLTVFGRSKNNFQNSHKKVNYIYGNFDDTVLLGRAIFNSDIVIHLLNTCVPYTASLDPITNIKSNVIGTINLLEELKKYNVKKIIYVSSGGTVYGNPDYSPTDERHPLRPISAYGISKGTIENYIKLYSQKYGFTYSIVRPSNPYGPRQPTNGIQGVISTFLYKILMRERLEIWGDGEAIRDYIHIDDVSDFFEILIEKDFNGVINLGSGCGYSVNQIINIIERCIGKKANIEYKDLEVSNVKKLILSTVKAEQCLGWEPLINIDDGIRTYYSWLKNNI